MAVAPLPMVQMQLAFAIGLIGIYAGWRGTIARMTGFYDLSGAVKTLMFGLVAGVFAASAIDALLLSNIRSETANIVWIGAVAVVIAMAESAFALFLLGRPRTVGLRASAPYGWTLGLGFGSMRAAHLNVRLFDPEVWPGTTGFEAINIAVALALTLTACFGHAMITAWQGSRIIEHQRARTFFTSTLARAILIIATVLAVFTPILLIFFAPALVLLWDSSQRNWLPAGMTPAASQAYRRTIRGTAKHERAAEQRIPGHRVFEEE